VHKLLPALMIAAALAFGLGYLSSPTHAQDTDQTQAGSDQSQTEESAQPDDSGSPLMDPDQEPGDDSDQ
jgi:hypothetical protein